jgi:hypothetical protein
VPPTEEYRNMTSTAWPGAPVNSTEEKTFLELYEKDNSILMRSSFSHFYQMDKIGVFKQFFATVFPILLIVVMSLVLFNILNIILAKVGLGFLQMGTCEYHYWYTI